jgi:hypothetical protein
MRKVVAVFAAVAALVLVVGVPPADAAPDYSINWSGYAVPGANITAVNGSWIVPLIRNAPPGFSSSWIGIGGYRSNDLIQTGTASSGRIEGNYAWYEMLPDNEQRITGCGGDANCTVRQGDRVSASVTNVGGANWVISMVNAGKWSWSKAVTYQSTLSSAEWVFEAPTLGVRGVPVGLQTLPAYAPHARFLGGGTYRMNGATQPLTASVAKRMIMVDMVAGWYRTATPSLLAGDGHFTVCAYKRTCPNF